MGRLGEASKVRVCYEAGPTGSVLYWQLTRLGVHCEVVAPSLVPVKAGDAAQERTLLEYIGEVEHQSARVERLDKALDEAVQSAPEHMKAVIEALQSLRGVGKLTAVSLAVEVGTFRRFERATQLMSYTGMVPSESSSGPKRWQGAITKAGNNHLRRVLIEAAWHNRHRPHLSQRQRAVNEHLEPEVVRIAWEAQLRLNARYRKLSAKGKPAGKVVTAIARELVGFIWAVGTRAEQTAANASKQAA